jgi:hypothetical protein
VFEYVADGVGGFGREDGNRRTARHPDGEFGDEKVRAVLRQDGDARAGLEPKALQMRRHAARFIEGLRPGVVAHQPAAERLREEHPARLLGFVVENVIEDEFLSHGRLRNAALPPAVLRSRHRTAQGAMWPHSQRPALRANPLAGAISIRPPQAETP